ncbi:MAG: hypothetical protein ACYDCL_23720 [Myxococcales bacterium]
MPLVRKEEVEDLVDEFLALADQGATHQALGGLAALGKRLGKSGASKADLERVAAAIARMLSRDDLLGMTAQEEADLHAAREACLARAASLTP